MSWELKKLSQIIPKTISGEWGDDVGSVKVLRTTNFQNDGTINFENVVTRSITQKKIDQKALKFGDTIIEKSGGSPSQPVGRVVFFDKKNDVFLCNNFTSILRPSSITHPKYVFWFLFNNHLTGKTLRYQNKTTGIINLKLERYLEELKIPTPPIDTQKRIAEILDKADALRKKDKQLLQYFDDLAQSLFIDMFGDPVRNEKGWEMESLGNFTSLVSSGSTPLGGSNVYQKSGVKFIRSQNVLMNQFSFDDIVYISEEIHNKMSRTWVKKNDVLINITGASIGRVSVYKIDELANVNQHVCIVRTNGQALSPIYLSYLIANDSFQRKTISGSSGGTREAFNFTQIKNFKIIYPSTKLQNQFADQIQNIEQQKEKLKAQLQESENLFQALLQKAFNGGLN